MLASVRYLLAEVHGTIAICMGTAGGFDEEYCGQMMVGALASFKYGRPARARSSNFPVSSKRLTSTLHIFLNSEFTQGNGC
ncbi:hypothetical protein TNCV_1210511 [Trichonephila clavipes]|nr:hypothetical protein TNCV_1210511 [Trichonephila clavipes]